MLGKGLESLIPPSEPGEEKLLPPVSDMGQATGNKEAFPSSSPQLETVSAAPSSPAISTPAPAIERVSQPLSVPSTPASPLAASSQHSRDRAVPRTESVFQIEVEKIAPNPHQPRKEFNEESLRELAQSIREFGILQPLVVTKVERETPTGVDVSYELIAGERRLMAAKLLGLPRVPAIVRTVDTERDRLEMAVIENIQRENLNPVEMARAFARLQDEFRLTQREIASRLGKSREVVANTLRLLDAPTYIQDAVSRGEISESHARLLLSVSEPDAQEKLFRDLLDKHLTTRELRLRIGTRNKEQGTRDMEQGTRNSETPALSPEFLALEEKLSAELGTPVKIARSETGGKITILFYSPEELQGILKRLGGKEE
ncbi:MAG: ParB/RepB/Spo0J family partition protein [Candidatus Liptonbacteria bacterium]|nr:ParB/RepB/Spo0J family partition protein [Candidatus Liptonbacteria bacterium]